MNRPILIVVTGRPGAGKTTLAETLSREWRLPLVSRDRIKEGYVHTAKAGHDALENGNAIATAAFFDTLSFLLDRDISCIAEAAFQHRLWSARLPALQEKADVRILLCRPDAHLAHERFLRRGLSDPSRLYFHGDDLVRAARSGAETEPALYEEPSLPLPTYPVDTTDGYRPSLEELKKAILGQ